MYFPYPNRQQVAPEKKAMRWPFGFALMSLSVSRKQEVVVGGRLLHYKKMWSYRYAILWLCKLLSWNVGVSNTAPFQSHLVYILCHLCFSAWVARITENLRSFRDPCLESERMKRIAALHQTALSKCWQPTSMYLIIKTLLWCKEQKWGSTWQAMAKELLVQ